MKPRDATPRRQMILLALHVAGMLVIAFLLHPVLLAAATGLLGWACDWLTLQAAVVQAPHIASLGVDIPLLALDAGAPIPIDRTPLLHLALVAGLLCYAAWQWQRQRALATCLLTLGSVHGFASLWLWVMPMRFPGSLLDHTQALCAMFVLCLYGLPVLLQASFASLGLSAMQAWRSFGLIVTALFIAMPLQMLVHTVLVQHLTRIMLPLLLIGAVLVNAMLILAVLGVALGREPRKLEAE